MPILSGNLSINNGAATPVAKTFSTTKKDPQESIFEERSSTVPFGYVVLKVRHQRPTATRRTFRTTLELAQPLVRTDASSISSLLATNRAMVTFISSDSCTQAERDDLVAFTINALNNASIKPVAKDNDPIV